MPSEDRQNLLPSETKKPTEVSFLQLFRFTSTCDKLLLIIGSVVAVFAGLAQPLLAFFLGKISQSFISLASEVAPLNDTDPRREVVFAKFHEEVAFYCLLYVVLGVLSFLVGSLQTWSFSVVGENMTHRLRCLFFRAIMRQEVAWFDNQKAGTLSSQLFANIDQFKTGSSEHIGLMFRTFSMYIGGFLICLYFDWRLTLIGTSMSPIIGLLGYPVSKKSVALAKEKQEKGSEAGALAEQSLSSMKTVMYFNGQEYECSKYLKCLDVIKKVAIRKALHEGLCLGLFMFLLYFAFFLTVWKGTDYVFERKLEGGFVISLFMIITNCTGRLDRITYIMSGVFASRGAAAKIYEIIDREPEIDSHSDAGERPPVEGKIAVKNIGFSYPARPEHLVLKDVSFTVEAGQTVAIVGASGSGKSTIVQLLLRFYDPVNGSIVIDGRKCEDYNLRYLRESIASVFQEPALFDTTIAENIRYGRENISEEQIWQVLKLANAYNFVNSFPKGLKTLVGDRGAQLSGGQKQRIAIARALVRDPKILLLDEATSALDAESERVVQQALENASKERTTIIVAHRLSTIKNADKIIVMEHGKIVECGTHSKLMSLAGTYNNLVTNQVFEEKDQEIESLLEEVTTERITTRADNEQAGNDHQETGVLEDPTKKRLLKEMEEEGVSQASFWRILREARSEWKTLLVAMAVVLAGGFVQPGYAFIFTEVIRAFSGPKEEILEHGHFLSFCYLFLGAFYAVILAAEYYILGRVSESFGHTLRMKTYRNIMRQDAAFFDKPSHAPGRLLTRLATDTENIKPALNLRFGTVLSFCASNLIATSIGLYIGWQMTLLALPLFSLGYCGMFARFRYQMRRNMQDQKDMEASGKIATEAIQNFKTVQSLNFQDAVYEKFCIKLERPLLKSRIKCVVQGVSDGAILAIDYFVYAFCFRWGLYLIYHKYMDAHSMLQALILTGWCSLTLGALVSYLPDFAKAKMAAALMFKLMDEVPSVDGMSESGSRPEIEGNIKIHDIHFRYPERRDAEVLKGVSLELKKGETVALVGASGCGKSTVVSLLERLYNLDQGKITFDENVLSSMNPKYVREHLSIVSQEPVLFDLSVKENILYGLPEGSVNHMAMIEAAKMANIHDFVSCLPEGYSTRVTGSKLSGGQKQRIAIARALIREPKILILDEATSALDTESEKHVQLALDQAKTGRSCLVIAHRLSTIRNAHQIVVMAAGTILEKGTHEELLQKKGVYYNLVQKQTQSS